MDSVLSCGNINTRIGKNLYKWNLQVQNIFYAISRIGSEITNIFFHEVHELYYVPYVNRKDEKPKAARGKLWRLIVIYAKILKIWDFYHHHIRPLTKTRIQNLTT